VDQFGCGSFALGVMKIIEILKLLSDPKFQRIVVVGTSCSGKTTIARKLAQTLGFTYIELDAIYWKPNWCPRSLEEFRALVEKATAGESWVVDGNYSKVRDLIWKRATHIIWLNLPFYLVLGRALRRTVSRIVSQEELFSGNRETWRLAFLDRDSVLWWMIKTFHRKRREYRALFEQNRGDHLACIELRTQHQIDEFLHSLKDAATTWINKPSH
jgi:adenylate kinase family enzyme